ncbi:hypothetical protein AGMMS49982_05070 [Bacteroidia bacterium]|nr:hypothetical protein AGMMS49982_05070 [Bacteroidia bacterium]
MDKEIESLNRELEEFNSAKAEMQKVTTDVRRCLSHVVYLIKSSEFQKDYSNELKELLSKHELFIEHVDTAIGTIKYKIGSK